MFGPQTHTILQSGINKLADFGETAVTDIATLKSSIATLSSDVQSMKQDIQTLLTASTSQTLPTPGGLPSVARATPDVVISEIFTLLKDEDYESAFNKALSLSRIDVLNRIISFVDYSALFATEPCPLSQSVLLSLLNQIGTPLLKQDHALSDVLGCDLVTDTETKLEWIRGAVTHLDATPASPRVGTLTMGVLDYLISRTQSEQQQPLHLSHSYDLSNGLCCRHDQDGHDVASLCRICKDDIEHADWCSEHERCCPIRSHLRAWPGTLFVCLFLSCSCTDDDENALAHLLGESIHHPFLSIRRFLGLLSMTRHASYESVHPSLLLYMCFCSENLWSRQRVQFVTVKNVSLGRQTFDVNQLI